MKYYLFAGDVYYAQGGVRDLRNSSEDLDTLIAHGEDLIKQNKEDDWAKIAWYHIADENMKIVHQSALQAHSY